MLDPEQQAIVDPCERIVDESLDVGSGRIAIREPLNLRAGGGVHLAHVHGAVPVRIGPELPVPVVVQPVVQEDAPPAVRDVVPVRVQLGEREIQRGLEQVRPGGHEAGQVDQVIRPEEIRRALVRVLRRNRPRVRADLPKLPIRYEDGLRAPNVVILHRERVR